MIKQEGSKWVLYSKDGSKVLGTYGSEEEAKAREAQVEQFKHMKAEGITKEDGTEWDEPGGFPMVAGPAPTSFAAMHGATEQAVASATACKYAQEFGILAGNVIRAGVDVPNALQGLCDEFMVLVLDAYGVAAEADVAEADLAEDDLQLERLGESVEVVFCPEMLHEAATLAEAEETLAEGEARSLLYMDVQLIRPGWGNRKDSHYYPEPVLRRDSHLFEGMKMYETDHKQAEKSTRTWVSSIQKVTGFTEKGAPIARVAVIDPVFADKMRNLAAAGLTESMECSILADGLTVAGNVDGRPAKIVEAITAPYSVDWVTKAGAGGHVTALVESAEGAEMLTKQGEKPVEKPVAEATVEEAAKPEATVVVVAEAQPEVTLLSEADVEQALQESNLPGPAQERLKVGKYATAEAVQEAIVAERDYIKRVTGAGAVTGGGGTAAKGAEAETPLAEREVAVLNSYLHLG